MVDSRAIVDKQRLKELQNNESVKELIMRNWVDIHGVRAIVANVMNVNSSDQDQFYSQYRMTNTMFLKVLRQKYSKALLKRFGVWGKTNSEVLGQLLIISSFFKGMGV